MFLEAHITGEAQFNSASRILSGYQAPCEVTIFADADGRIVDLVVLKYDSFLARI